MELLRLRTTPIREGAAFHFKNLRMIARYSLILVLSLWHLTQQCYCVRRPPTQVLKLSALFCISSLCRPWQGEVERWLLTSGDLVAMLLVRRFSSFVRHFISKSFLPCEVLSRSIIFNNGLFLPNGSQLISQDR